MQRGELERPSLPTLRVVIFAGEVFPIKYLARLMELVPHPRFLNFYGPTETNVCTWYEVPRDDSLAGRPADRQADARRRAVIAWKTGRPRTRG